MSSSCIYEGAIRHRRLEPRREFRRRLALAYLDVEELPRLLGGRLVLYAHAVGLKLAGAPVHSHPKAVRG